MKKFLLFSYLLLLSVAGFSQQLPQYNTGTLYDSFENPSQPAFIPDTSRRYAFNFLIPALSGNFYLTGDAQATLVNRAFGGKYNNADLQIANGKFNNFKLSGSAYFIMFKVFGSVKGNSEIGIFAQSKTEGSGRFSDESVAIFNGPDAFSNNVYDNIFNDHYYYQIYNSIGMSYREALTKKFSVGIKLGFLMGLDYSKLDIYQSHITFDNVKNTATLSLQGKYYQSKGPGNFDARSLLPTTRSPGVQVTLGTAYKTDDNITIQANLKDFGFIHWFNESHISNFNTTQTIYDLRSSKREDSIYSHVNSILHNNRLPGSFSTPTDAKFELSATKSYWMNDERSLKYSPTLIVSKEMYYSGATGAVVNRFEYDEKYNLTLTGAYNNVDLLSIGLQLMFKTYRGEFYIGSDKLMQTASLLSSIHNYQTYANSSFTGASFFMGFSYKFGPVIEHALNSSVMETGEKGFLGRLYNRLFKTYQ